MSSPRDLNYQLTELGTNQSDLLPDMFMNLHHTVGELLISRPTDTLYENKWATTRQNVSSGLSNQARHKQACAATEAS